ncbi:hypothetical protein AQUCO_01400913v1 [Aquilegia coerulea]|uniref:Bifunctional inhibitor/plant lipid transfer protein/seed storage helical domain-containing protein n=1 Tax=Aquilegia coerulea TaxID=218851 RepID=A0A2G5DZF3_AQUCA|nr:hypothetical protein AQUCO_01400913v1 [Aquilegia coerulea]
MIMGSYCYMTTSLMILLMMVTFVNSDVAKDRDECASQLVGLATCLPYVSGTGKAPTLECCSGLKEVLGKSRKCLCVLVKDRNDPELDLKINATLALGLPAVCKLPSNASECPGMYVCVICSICINNMHMYSSIHRHMNNIVKVIDKRIFLKYIGVKWYTYALRCLGGCSSFVSFYLKTNNFFLVFILLFT